MNKKPFWQDMFIVLISLYMASYVSPASVTELNKTPMFTPPVSTQVIHPRLETQEPTRTNISTKTVPALPPLTPTLELTETQTIVVSKPGWIAFTLFSEDGSDSEIFRIRTDGTGLVNLTNSPGYDESPTWSPDGTLIAFTSNRDGKTQLYIMDENGNNVSQLSEIAPIFTRPSWSPDGHKLVFTSKGQGDNTDIYILDLGSSEIKNITNSPYHETGPDWSPNVQRILFGACSDSNLADEYVEECYIDIMELSTNSVIRLTNISDFLGFSAWSPDSTKIASSCNLNLCIINADGSGRIEFDKELYHIDVQDPTWSPDGRRLALFL